MIAFCEKWGESIKAWGEKKNAFEDINRKLCFREFIIIYGAVLSAVGVMI